MSLAENSDSESKHQGDEPQTPTSAKLPRTSSTRKSPRTQNVALANDMTAPKFDLAAAAAIEVGDLTEPIRIVSRLLVRHPLKS